MSLRNKALDRLGLGDRSVIKEVSGHLTDPSYTLDCDKYGEFWDGVGDAGGATTFAIDLIQRMSALSTKSTGSKLGFSGARKEKNTDAARRVVQNMCHTLLFLELYADVNSRDRLFQKALNYWFSNVTDKAASEKKGKDEGTGPAADVVQAPVERLLLSLYTRKHISNRDVLAPLVVYCVSINASCLAAVTGPAPITGRRVFAAPGDFPYLFPYLQGVAIDGFQLEFLLTYLLNLLRSVPQHVKRRAALISDTVRSIMFMIRVFTTLHPVPDPATLASMLPIVAALETWPAPIGHEALRLRDHLRSEVLTPGTALRRSMFYTYPLLTPRGEEFERAAGAQKRALAWARALQRVHIFAQFDSTDSWALEANFGLTSKPVREGDALDSDVDDRDVEMTSQELAQVRQALLHNLLELDLGVSEEDISGVLDALPRVRLQELSSRARDIVGKLHSEACDDWDRRLADMAVASRIQIPHGDGVAPMTAPTSGRRASALDRDSAREVRAALEAAADDKAAGEVAVAAATAAEAAKAGNDSQADASESGTDAAVAVTAAGAAAPAAAGAGAEAGTPAFAPRKSIVMSASERIGSPKARLDVAHVPVNLTAAHLARHAKLSLLWKEMAGGRKDSGSVRHSKWFRSRDAGAEKSYSSCGNFVQNCLPRLADHPLVFVQASALPLYPKDEDLTAVDAGVAGEVGDTCAVLDASLDPPTGKGTARAAGRAGRPVSVDRPRHRSTSGDGDGSRPGRALSMMDVALTISEEAEDGGESDDGGAGAGAGAGRGSISSKRESLVRSQGSSSWFLFDKPSVVDSAEAFYPPGGVAYYAPQAERDYILRTMKQANLMQAHYARGDRRRQSTAVAGGGVGQKHLDMQKPTVRLCAAGNLGTLHNIVCALVALRVAHPKLMKAVSFRVFVLPFEHHDVADYLGSRDSWYRRQILAPFCRDMAIVPPLGPPRAPGIEVRGEAITPLVVNRHLMRDYFRWGDQIVPTRVFDCECWAAGAAPGAPPSLVIPFVCRVELGVNTHVALYQAQQAEGQDIGFTPPSWGDVLNEKAFSRAFGVTTPEVPIRFKRAALTDEGDAVLFPPASYASLAISNFPAPGDGGEKVGHPDDAVLHMYSNSGKGTYAAKLGKRESKRDIKVLDDMRLAERDVQTVSMADIGSNTGKPFYATIDGHQFGPFVRIRVGPCRAVGTPLVVPLATFWQSDMGSPVP